MDQLRSMRVFARVIDEGSFAAAARALDLAPAVVTRLVAELESHLGARLLNRTTRRLALTEIGQAYLQRVRTILIEVEEAESLAASQAADPAGHLRVYIPPSISVWLAGRLGAFRQAYPGITLDWISPASAGGLDEGCDVSVLMTQQTEQLEGGFVARPLARTDVVICASPAYIAQHGRPGCAAELSQHDCLVAVSPISPREWFVRNTATGENTLLPMRVALTSNHVETLKAAALAGMGVVALPSYMLVDALRAGTLVRLLADTPVQRNYVVHAAYPSRQYLPARTRVFMDFLVTCFGGSLDRDPWLDSLAAPPAFKSKTAAPASRPPPPSSPPSPLPGRRRSR